MNLEMARKLAYLGDEHVKGRIRGVVLAFHGLGFSGMKTEMSTEELAWAQPGGLVVFPYYGPWSWMNRQARAFVDDLVDSVFRGFSLDDKTPIVSTGGSMGGLSCLLHARYSRRRVSGVLAVCPVCDAKYHFSERPDLARTMFHAFGNPDEKQLQEAFAEHSPVVQVAGMPDVPYMIVHGMRDAAVSKAHHSDVLVARMRQRKLNVEYVEVDEMGHCSPMPFHVLTREVRFVTSILHGEKAGH